MTATQHALTIAADPILYRSKRAYLCLKAQLMKDYIKFYEDLEKQKYLMDEIDNCDQFIYALDMQINRNKRND